MNMRQLLISFWQGQPGNGATGRIVNEKRGEKGRKGEKGEKGKRGIKGIVMKHETKVGIQV